MVFINYGHPKEVQGLGQPMKFVLIPHFQPIMQALNMFFVVDFEHC